MSYRTLHTHGIVTSADAAGTVVVDGVIVHQGQFNNGILFNFITDTAKHGKVPILIKMVYGSISITNIRVTYPAKVNGLDGFINIPQPISQPLHPFTLPITVDSNIEYNHYMFNGPTQWIVNGKRDTQTLVLDSLYDNVESGVLNADWGYQHISVDIESLDDISSLK